MDAQLCGLEGKLDKSLAKKAEMEHRQRQIAAELNKGFVHASRYEELRLRLITLNKQLTESGAEIEPSPELANLDEEAFQSIKPGISVRQILSLTGEFVYPGEEKTITLDSQNPIALNPPALEPKCLITLTTDISLAQNEVETDQINTSADAASKSKNDVIAVPDRDRNCTRLQSCEVDLQGVTTTKVSQQMCFDWP